MDYNVAIRVGRGLIRSRLRCEGSTIRLVGGVVVNSHTHGLACEAHLMVCFSHACDSSHFGAALWGIRYCVFSRYRFHIVEYKVGWSRKLTKKEHMKFFSSRMDC